MNIFKTFTLSAMLLMSISSYAQQAEHVVQRGEDFTSIAEKYGIKVDDLKAANPQSAVCSVGRKLYIPRVGETIVVKETKELPKEVSLKSDEKAEISHTSAFHVGHVLWKKTRYDAAKNYLLDAAKEGDVRAYYPLADCYSREDGGCYDEVQAVEYFTKTTEVATNKANDQYWMACLKLAEIYLNGKGTAKDPLKARRYYDEFKNSTDKPITDRAKALGKQIAHEAKSVKK